jgi:hypothetical protein
LAITFTPTLTPDYQLKYGFNNIAKIEISYILQNKNIQMIHLAAPTGISIIGTYCNATLESTSIETAPYPFRFKCQVMSTGYIQLIKQKDFPAWDSGFINRKVIIYLKYTIATSVAVACSDWVATAYTGLSVSSSNVVSQAKGFFNVD